VRSDVFSFNKNNDFFYIKKDKPVIYVTGGSLGSHSINMHVKKILPELLSKFTVIHQTGNVKEYNDYKVLSDYIKTLPDYLKNSYFIKKHFQTGEVGTVFNIADLVISRAGANTLFELIALKKTAVLVPLPWSSHGEQEKQALMLKKEGGAEVFYQQEDSNKLLVLVNKVLKDKKSYINNLLKLQKLYVQDAAKVITEEIIAK
jgi:UDP-N-acetylglucosamine--N-acetylmuramyl-(pentapeptide) pyrophosphoryl-undecaprenol N-acetylglucosamine transferase